MLTDDSEGGGDSGNEISARPGFFHGATGSLVVMSLYTYYPVDIMVPTILASTAFDLSLL